MATMTAFDRTERQASPGLKNPAASDRRVRAVLLDLDGTLYRQKQMQRSMAFELLTLVTNPLLAPRRLRVIREYRKALEQLRAGSSVPSQTAQLARAAERAGVSYAEADAVVQEWMQRRPLKHLLRCRAAGVIEFLDFLDSHRIPAAVFSDYAPADKIAALGLAGRFSFAISATDPEVMAFKPNPRGFLAACSRWGLAPADVLMVGDRVDVDGAGAVAAGMPCVIISASSDVNQAGVMVLPSFERLLRVLDARD
jgi:HAD superfamily hydrolase (TIGR01549 family)